MGRRLDWEDYFAIQALLVSQRSTCDRALVGSVLVKDKRIIATGYNGSISGDEHCDDCGHLLVEGHCVRTVHAEQNAITQCAKYGIDTLGSEIYVTHFPCLNCTKALLQAGIKKVNYLKDYRKSDVAAYLFEKANVETVKMQLDKKELQHTFESILDN